MRKRIYEVIELSQEDDSLSKIYDIFMMGIIIISLIPMAFKEEYLIFQIFDRVAVTVFMLDYLLRWGTADYKFKEKGILPFIKYPFSGMAIIDLLSILPSVTIVNRGFRTLRIVRLIRTFRIFRVFKTLRYSKNMQIIINVIGKSKDALIAVGTLAVGYIIVSALVIFNVEAESFSTFFDAVYWATVSLTTVGYGDIYPVTTFGRVITMISAFVGIAIVALPAGIITAGYMEEISINPHNEEEPR